MRIQRTVLFVSVLALAAMASGCGRQCKKAREEIIQPTQVVQNYLMSDSGAVDLALNGCTMILKQFEKLPHGARVIRSIAETRFSHTVSHCLHWETSYRYQCYPQPHPRRPVCYSQPYTYCARWDYDTIREPGYAQAIELSQDLDALYERSHTMCGKADSGSPEEAYTLSRELLTFLTAEVKPESEKVYAMACGN